MSNATLHGSTEVTVNETELEPGVGSLVSLFVAVSVYTYELGVAMAGE